MTENADLQSRMHRELAEAQQQLREKVSFDQFRHCKSTVLTDLQEEQMANDAEIHSRLLKEKVCFNLSRHCNTTVLSNLQEAHVTNVTQQLREKVSVLKLSLQFL